MILSDDAAALDAFRSSPRTLQRTFETPLKHLPEFVSTIVSVTPWEWGCATLDLVVFEPQNLISLLRRKSISPRYQRGVTLAATGKQEIEELLRAILADWVDFLFIGEPEFVDIYADHDEFTTLFAKTAESLDWTVDALCKRGFHLENNFHRQF